MARHLNVTAIFGGIGGIEAGLHRHGHQTSLFCESDPEASAVLAVRFPGVPITFDIRRTDEVIEAISPKSELLTAGFPCTDLSQAGTTKGFAGGRSSLIRDTIALIRRRPFPYVLLENVPNWRHLHRGTYLGEVLGALEALGYRWAYRTIDARAFGLPHRRQRIFVFAALDGDPREVLFHGEHEEEEGEYPLTDVAHGFYWTEGSRGLGWGEDCVPTLKGGSAIGIPAPPAILMPDLSIVTPALADAERMQGFPAGWTDVAHVLPKFGSGPFNRRKRWQLIGNAVNVEASAWIGEQLAGAAPYDGENGRPLRVGEPWPAAAWYDGQTRRIATHGLWPARRRRQSLAGFLLHGGAPLSRRATAGFLARITTSRLRFKAGFREAVERHLRRMEQNAVVLAIGSTHHAGLTDRGESSRWPDRCSIRMPQHPNG